MQTAHDTAVQRRLAGFLDGISTVAELEALPLLYGENYGHSVIPPLHEQIGAMTIGAISHIHGAPDTDDLITRVSAVIMRSIALGYQFREREYQRAIREED